MHKRHGEVVTRVLQQKIAERAAKLVEGTIDDTSLLALVIGKKHLGNQGQLAAEAKEDEHSGPTKSQSGMTSASPVQPQNAALAKVEELLQSLLAKFSTPRQDVEKGEEGSQESETRSSSPPSRWDSKVPDIVHFCRATGSRPKWSDSGAPALPGFPPAY